ncbi:hypothetical protein GCM10009107_57240 [Ideonella azotifigens]|uniref:Uncharacterized protein n=1 Tax=Ideonella azotifigens TaxID=513160 RepID=A0ABN1KIG4_9BURK
MLEPVRDSPCVSFFSQLARVGSAGGVAGARAATGGGAGTTGAFAMMGTARGAAGGGATASRAGTGAATTGGGTAGSGALTGAPVTHEAKVFQADGADGAGGASTAGAGAAGALASAGEAASCAAGFLRKKLNIRLLSPVTTTGSHFPPPSTLPGCAAAARPAPTRPANFFPKSLAQFAFPTLE